MYESSRAAERYLALRADVTTRLSPSCAHFGPERFDELVHEICVMKLRWDQRELAAR